jgi:hypothetical protein
MPDSSPILMYDRQQEDPATCLLNELSLLVKTESVYRSWSERGQRLATQLAASIEEFASEKALNIYRNGREFEVQGEVIDGTGRRRDLMNRMRALNLKCVAVKPGVTGEDLQQFAALMNGRFRELMATGNCSSEWEGMPETIEVDETYYDPQSKDGAGLLRQVPRMYLTYRKLKRLIRQLKDLQDKLSEMGEEQTKAVDVIHTLLDTLTKIETYDPEQAEALIETTLERFQAALDRVQESGISTKIGGLVQGVARKYFPRLTVDGEIGDPPQAEREDNASDLFDLEGEQPEDGEIEAFAKEIDALLAVDHPMPVFEPPSDRADASVLVRFLNRQESPKVLEAVAGHLTTLCTQTEDAEVIDLVREKLLSGISGLAGHESVKGLIDALMDASDVETILEGIDLGDEADVQRFLETAGALWPMVLPGLFTKLGSAPPATQRALMKPLLRRVGRDAILGTGDWLLANVLYRGDIRRWIRALQIPETLPLVEVLFTSQHPTDKRQGWLLARAYPFKQKAAFWLKAAQSPLAITDDYFRALLAAEWTGRQDYHLFQVQLQQAKAWVFEPDREAARMAIRALAIADIDDTAEFLIQLLRERRLVFFPRYRKFLRREARIALPLMACPQATLWKRKMRG